MRFSNRYGFYELNPFPGCNQIVVSNHALIYEQFRGQGHGQQQHFERLMQARELGYNRIICTVRADNEAERHILLKNGWEMNFTFTSTETKHEVQMWSRNL
jgi:RimJ/RimL family protein N-acetyltransferase